MKYVDLSLVAANSMDSFSHFLVHITALLLGHRDKEILYPQLAPFQRQL